MEEPIAVTPLIKTMIEMNIIYAQLLSLGLDHSKHGIIKIPKTEAPEDKDPVCDLTFHIENGGLFMTIDVDETCFNEADVLGFVQRGKKFLQNQLLLMQPRTIH